MIHDPPLLRIRRRFARPDPALLAAFADVPTGNLVDAMGGRGCLDYRIRALVPERATLCGTAVTCEAGPADNLALFGALDVAGRGDVLVCATDGFTATSVTGDLLLGMARNRGIAGLVTDGLVRDLAGILAVGLPVHCAGLTANSPARNGPGSVGLPVVVGGVRVASGDIIVADRDGVVIVPLDQAEAVQARLVEVRAAETALDSAVRAGLEIPEFVRSILASDRVEEIE
ncbi:MAG TPA: 4-hydroxy-4-methyl-2-oxoglutarate aldolase [Acetobacteraceae bacterium]|nr:4-hydroxy-4-methyl-2-oxoglutarate aldolase [Acetobacteraceae bacterium]